MNLNSHKDLSIITEVHEIDQSVEPRAAPPPEPIFSSSSSLHITPDSSPIPQRVRDHWRSTKVKLHGHSAVRSIDTDILTYGTSNELTDHDNHYKLNIDQLITIKTEKKDHFRSVNTEDEIELPENKWLLKPNGIFKRVWNPVIALALLYTATLMPYRLAFEEEVFWDFWVVLELVIDGLFIVDIAVNFRSVAVMDDGNVESDRKKVAQMYLRGWFTVDFISSLPFTLLDYYLSQSDQNAKAGKYNNAIRLMRLPRLYKLLRVVRVLKAFRLSQSSGVFVALQDCLQINSRVFKLVKFLLYVMVAVHLMACVWFFSSKVQNFALNTWVVRYGFSEKSISEQYLAAVYFSITTLVTVGYGDICAESRLEVGIVILWMIVGVGFYSFTVGSLSSFLTSIDTRESALALKVATIQVIAKETGLPEGIRTKMQFAIAYNTSLTGSIWSDKHSLFRELPKSLRFEVATSMYNGIAKDLLFLRGKDQAFINYVMPLFTPTCFSDATILYREFEHADEVFFLTSGKVSMLVKGFDVSYKSYMRWSYVGEIEVIRGINRLATCVCISNTEVLTISKADFLKILQEFPVEKREICRIATNRLRREKQAYIEILELLKLKRKKGSLKDLRGKKQLLKLDKFELERWQTQEEVREMEIQVLLEETAEFPRVIEKLRESARELEHVIRGLPALPSPPVPPLPP